MRKVLALFVILTLLASALPGLTQDMVELRIRWYDDGNEGEVLRDLLDRFEADNPDISVEIDTVPLPRDSGELAAGPGGGRRPPTWPASPTSAAWPNTTWI